MSRNAASVRPNAQTGTVARLPVSNGRDGASQPGRGRRVRRRVAAIGTAALGFAALAGDAAAGACRPDNGPQNFAFAFDARFTSPDANAHKRVLENAYTWNLGQTYLGTCACNQSFRNVYYSAVTHLAPGYGGTVGGNQTQFYQISRNIQVAFEVFIGGMLQAYVPVPFSMVSNRGTSNGAIVNCWGNNGGVQFESGGRGRLHLMIDRPFVGRVDIPSTRILDVYGVSDPNDPLPATPIATVWMSGRVEVPQNCRIVPGAVTVDFGSLNPGQIAEAGQRPLRPVSTTLQVQCANISEMVSINVSLEAQPSSRQSNALAVIDRDDLAIVVESGGRVVAPRAPGQSPSSDNSIPLQFDVATQRSQFSFDAYPVKFGKSVQPGAFRSLAILKFDFE